jgi:hypothetical protein
MVFGMKDNGMDPFEVLCVGCGTNSSRLMPNVAELSGGAVGLSFHKCSYRAPHTLVA